MPDPHAVARELADRIDALTARELTKLRTPALRATAAHDLLERFAAIEATVRIVRGSAIRQLRAEDVTWQAIGELLDVTRQRAQQLALPQLSEAIDQ